MEEIYSDLKIAFIKGCLLTFSILMLMGGLIGIHSGNIIIVPLSILGITFGLFISGLIITMALQGV